MVVVMREGAARSLQLFPANTAELSLKVRTRELTPGLARNTKAEPRREPNAKALQHLRCQQLHTSAETVCRRCLVGATRRCLHAEL